ncbi:MAG: UbiA family prenyltransferase [Candidatus Bathyarchaeota archaeon]|nr:UbiA family prenyltransferase [Candidatus Bathyarchaeum tardum]WGM90021.1 MAG: UbiA family prenyltransferase [Candidatus Bathyarchaeum tardum]WNZ29837.1 MAG: UbiA family prenyltransferase [Candidatus Bathyarchaeota archaeon]
MASFKNRLKAIIMLLRPPYWLMTGGLSVLTIFTLQRGILPENELIIPLVVLSAICISSGGFAFNDYVDQESDAIVKKNRPIPSKNLKPWEALLTAIILFVIGIAASATINWLCVAIAITDTVLLIAYSKYIKKHIGFLGSFLMGFLIGTSFVYGEAALFGTITITSLSLTFMSMGSIGGNVLRDVLSLEGDKKAGYATLAAKRGTSFATKVGATFFLLNVAGSPIPYLVGAVGYAYLIPIIIWDAILVVSGVSLLKNQAINNVKKHERFATRTMILIPLALVLGALT